MSKNELQKIFKNHFHEFLVNYGIEYENDCAIYRFEIVKKVVERFIKCGDYYLGLARVLC